MEVQELRQLLQNLREDNEQRPDPGIEHLSFIPPGLKSNVICMQSRPLTGRALPTIFVGTVRPNYVQTMWEMDVQKWRNCLSIGLNQTQIQLQFLPLPDRPEALDVSDAIPKVEAAKATLRVLPNPTPIRFVILGTGHSAFLHQAIEHLLREWCGPSGEPRASKDVEFFIDGDSKSKYLLQFCKWLCISNICDNLTLVNTMDYHPFGYASREFHPTP